MRGHGSFQPNRQGLRSDLILLVAFLLAVNLSVLANPTPQRGPPTGLPPPNPTATITYANGGGSAYISAEGDYLTVINQCRGLDGTRGLDQRVHQVPQHGSPRLPLAPLPRVGLQGHAAG
ncbi:hypothetical protein BCR44DRAFT_197347 [Catenaria anguillulae PL171]|uniref:Ricin B lectin domain-containing protein n=1 Tax=Catenaria anguillulae PL171 TaxID=765915 RepID=A0A1Y2HMS5_9FUNG|nr:hypothetical protein BCR44DRAFT_197347 [Catenaria anguillulae PL171]